MLDHGLRDQRKKSLQLVAILAGLIVIFLALRAVWQANTREPYMEVIVSSWCVHNYLDQHINCSSWAADMMAQYHDEIMACESGNPDEELKCIGELVLEP